jgi:exonuclease VII small subunit
MSHRLVEKAKTELEQAQSQLDAALRAWDASVSELWRTSIALTQAQKRMTHAHELLRRAVDATTSSHNKPRRFPDRGAAMPHNTRAKE